jgi:hypothetical protein
VDVVVFHGTGSRIMTASPENKILQWVLLVIEQHEEAAVHASSAIQV